MFANQVSGPLDLDLPLVRASIQGVSLFSGKYIASHLIFNPSMGRPIDRRGNNIPYKAKQTAFVVTQPPGNSMYPVLPVLPYSSYPWEVDGNISYEAQVPGGQIFKILCSRVYRLHFNLHFDKLGPPQGI